jgi:catechol 2,3-dioxygenase-like lactoylglutathione lyase family enzyme
MVNDLEAAVAFYTSHLGFTIMSKTAPAFADVVRGDLRLLLSGPASSAGRSMPDGRQPSPGGWNRIHLIDEDLATKVHRLCGRSPFPQRHRDRARRVADPPRRPIRQPR